MPIRIEYLCLAFLCSFSCSQGRTGKSQTPCTAVYVNSVSVELTGLSEDQLDQLKLVMLDGDTSINFTRSGQVFVSDTDQSGMFQLKGSLSETEIFSEYLTISEETSGCHAINKTLAYTCSAMIGAPSCVKN